MLASGRRTRALYESIGIERGLRVSSASRFVARLVASPRELGDPLAQAPDVLGVVVAARLADPPRVFLGRIAQEVPALEHQGATGVRLDPGDHPRLAVHGRQ